MKITQIANVEQFEPEDEELKSFFETIKEMSPGEIMQQSHAIHSDEREAYGRYKRAQRQTNKSALNQLLQFHSQYLQLTDRLDEAIEARKNDIIQLELTLESLQIGNEPLPNLEMDLFQPGLVELAVTAAIEDQPKFFPSFTPVDDVEMHKEAEQLRNES